MKSNGLGDEGAGGLGGFRSPMCKNGRSESFVLKVWSDPDGDRAPTAPVRGRITHLPSRAELYFTQLEKAFEFITMKLSKGRPSSPLSASVRGWLGRIGGKRSKRVARP